MLQGLVAAKAVSPKPQSLNFKKGPGPRVARFSSHSGNHLAIQPGLRRYHDASNQVYVRPKKQVSSVRPNLFLG